MRRRITCFLPVLAVSALASAPLIAQDQEFTGKVVEVVEGDLFRVAHGDRTDLVRLHGVDCPELAQPFGPEAKKFASDLLLGQEVTVRGVRIEPKDPDQGIPEDRLVAHVTLSEGTTAAQEILLAGMGWWYRGDEPSDPVLGSLCAKAIESKKGLWAGPAPLAPWDFRAAQQKQAKTPASGPSAPAAPMPPGPSLSPTQASETVFVTKTGKEYHRANCVRLDQSKKPLSRGQAVALGYKACVICFPRKAEAEPPALVQRGNAEYVPPREVPPEIRNNPVYKQMNPRFKTDAAGKVIGVTADNLSSNPIAAALGFQDGDVIQSVNGQPVTSEAQIAALVERYKDSKNFSVVVLRNGKPTTLNVTLPF